MEFDRYYKAMSMAEFEAADTSLFIGGVSTSTLSLDGSQILVEFKTKPTADTYLTHSEAMALKNTEAWKPVTDEI